jgi:SAM-dependent methyltransferase
MAEFDRYAQSYDRVLASALGTGGEVDRFAGYKVDEMQAALSGATVRSVLDFGCGVGRSLPFLQRAFPGARVYGFDPSSESVTAAQQRAPDSIVVDDLDEIASESFDCILVANVMHHVPIAARPGELVRCARLLGRSGSLFVFEHNPFNPVTRLVFDRCPFDRDASMLMRRDLERLGAQAGLAVRRRAYTLFLPFRGKVTAAVHRALAWLPLGAQYYVQFVRAGTDNDVVPQ